MSKQQNAGDSRSEAQWIGDIAHRTIERLESLRGELSNLARQFELMAAWSDTQGMITGSHMMRQYRDEALELGRPDAAERLVRAVALATGREKQEYHKHS